jgi:zinc protease
MISARAGLPVRAARTALAAIPAVALLALVGCASIGGRGAGGAEAERPPVITGADALRRLSYPTLRFRPPEPERFQLSNGVTVLFLPDSTLPLFDVFVNLRGGYSFFDRADFAAGSALLSLMRNGGTESLTPDSLDALLEFHALSLNASTDGSRILLGVRGLRRHLDLAMDVWGQILLHPRFDPAAIERWRVRELEATRHLGDFPGTLAVAEFNRIVYGEHPTGWMLTEEDLAPARLERRRMLELHARIACPEAAVIGAAGALTRAELEEALERALAGWAPCGQLLEPPPPPVVQKGPAVYVIPKRLAQSTIVVGQPGRVLLADSPDYYASRVANWVIGGSGPTSRLEARLRGEEGLAYSASTVWGVAREHERIFGAITHTRAESTVGTTELVLGTLREALADPPTRDEVALARESIVNGFVFGFGSSAQVVARQVSYIVDDLPADWMDRYISGIARVDRRQVASVLSSLDPLAFTVLIVGDTTAFNPAALGPYQILPPR